ncbi:hypothetical protein WICMUC_001002, partial [Wickerhamomyces mucosus]
QAEVDAKVAEYEKYTSLEMIEISFTAVTGIDLSVYDWDEIVEPKGKSNAMKSATESILNRGGKKNTKREILQSYNKYGLFGDPFIGTPDKVVDELEKWVDEYDIDGFNLGFKAVWPDNLEDIVDLIIPELQKRGLFWKDYPVKGGTFRENTFGKGQTFLHEDHPAYALRWQEGVSKEEFEKNLKAHEEERLARRS